MQGRLVPPEEGRFQSFPAQRWREEFPRARAAGLYCIEWIFDKPYEARNPIADDAGLAEMQALIAESGVKVRSICADYYMECRLVTPDGNPDRGAQEHLLWLIERASRLGVTYIVLPFVDSSSLGTPEQRGALGAALAPALPRAREHNIELHLETDLGPQDLAALLRTVDHPVVKANYDIGNSASLGYDPMTELSAIGGRLGSVHVKDRMRGGGTVGLGKGSADLLGALRKIREIGFDRWLVLQVAREEEIDHVALARRNRETVERLWTEAGSA
jgi:L-ribulose-5-phosphate 3-epimerase